ncbi:MAG: protein kinase [Deltaproteobacteria bacterium]|nr:protein kinase [Deltaproteobacteria bacterium]
MAIHCQTCGVELATWTGKCPQCGGSSPMEIRTPQDPMLGKLIGGKYKVVKKLGQGGMGSVYLAENVGIGQRVAIKFLNPSFFGEETVVARFLNEARSYGQLTHPHAVQLHEHGQDEDGNLYISMEYVEGEDLKRLLEKEKRLPIREALDIVLQICDVLAYAHGKGIVHRDLKPENVIMVKGLRGWHAKVVDFGVARLADGNRVTAAGSICGTPRYMAPEQAEGRDVDHRVDIYALGLVLYELLTGMHPFIASTIAETMRRQVMEPMPHLSVAAPELKLPDALDAAIQKAVATDPAQRFASLTDFAPVLVALIPTSTVDASLLSQGVEQAHTLLRGPPVEKTSHGTSPYDRSSSPSRLPIFAGLGALAALLGGAGIWFSLRSPAPALTEVRPVDVPSRPELPTIPPPPEPKSAVLPPADPEPPDSRPADTSKPIEPRLVLKNPTRPPDPGPGPTPHARPDPNTVTLQDAKAELVEQRFANLLGDARSAFNVGDLAKADTLVAEVPESSRQHAKAEELRRSIEQTRTLLNKADTLYKNGDCEGAIRVWNEVLRINRSLRTALEGIQKCKMQTPTGTID